MGFFSGPKPQPPPWQLQAIADLQFGDTQSMSRAAADSLADARQYRGMVKTAYGDLAKSLMDLSPMLEEAGKDSLDRYNKIYAPIEQLAGQEMLNAGSEAEQARAREAAYADSLMGARQMLSNYDRQAAQRGISGSMSNAANNPMLSLMMGAQAGSAGNRAAWAERERGQAIRRGALPLVSDYFDTAYRRSMTLPANLRTAAQAYEAAGGSFGRMAQSSLPLYEGALVTGSSAFDKFGAVHAANEAYRQAKHAHKQAGLSSAISIGLGALTGGLGAMGAGAGLGGMLGGAAQGGLKSMIGTKFGAGASAGLNTLMRQLNWQPAAVNSFDPNDPMWSINS